MPLIAYLITCFALNAAGFLLASDYFVWFYVFNVLLIYLAALRSSGKPLGFNRLAAFRESVGLSFAIAFLAWTEVAIVVWTASLRPYGENSAELAAYRLTQLGLPSFLVATAMLWRRSV